VESWKEKQEQAKELVEQIKEGMRTADNAEDVNKLRAQFDAAREMAKVAGNERFAVEKAQLEDVMSEYDRQETVKQNKAENTWQPAVQTGNDSFQAPMSQRIRGDAVRLVANKSILNSIPDLQRAALVEGTGASGGYLVVPRYMQELFAETRRQGNALRSYGWLNVHPVDGTNQIYLPKGGGTATVSIVGEGQTKPSADQTYSQIAVSIYTVAGISKQSKQLAMDSSPTVLDLSTRELGTLLGNYEEQLEIAGTGTGQPLGILNVTGLAIAPGGSDTVNGGVTTSATAQNIIDQILNAVVAVETQYYAPPNGVLMHPRRLAFLLKGKDTATNYLFNRGGTFRQPTAAPLLDTVTSMSSGTSTPPYDLFGLPIGTSTNIPTNNNYGAAGSSDQDAIIVGAWQEAHVFQRQDVTLDTSDVAGTAFETNQVWIRAEERFGFTAARYPTAFAVVFGKGLAATNV
jgi:HK97 family phage major capsid protein